MIEQVNDGDSGLTVRTTINQTIDVANSSFQLLGKGTGINLGTISDQFIALTSGKNIVTDVVFTNASAPISVMGINVQLNTETSRSGSVVFSIVGTFQNFELQSSNSYISVLKGNLPETSSLSPISIDIPSSGGLYFSLISGIKYSPTVDVYVYGYILS